MVKTIRSDSRDNFRAPANRNGVFVQDEHAVGFLHTALEIADEFDLEVIDLRTIVPMDDEIVFDSVKKTNRVLVLHEDAVTIGWGAEVVARIVSNCFDHLDAPVRRVGAKDSFVASA